jgi:hypothetical protein
MQCRRSKQSFPLAVSLTAKQMLSRSGACSPGEGRAARHSGRGREEHELCLRRLWSVRRHCTPDESTFAWMDDVVASLPAFWVRIVSRNFFDYWGPAVVYKREYGTLPLLWVPRCCPPPMLLPTASSHFLLDQLIFKVTIQGISKF